jgi:phage terminase large subunit-like protein
MGRRSRTVAEQYIADVLACRVPVSKLVKLQIERHADDLKHGKERGLYFDREAAQDVIDFFPLFACGVDGDYFGQPLELVPAWQALLWILYGWKRKDDKGRKLRRFKVAYSEMGAGNLKSLVLSALCLYELCAFGEMGARVYAAATDRKTSRRVFDTASTMAMQSDYLREHLLIGKEAIAHPLSDSKFEPCAAEDQNLQGLRPSFVCIDELHAHTSAGVWNAFYSRLGKTTQPLIFAITNSGMDRNSVCYKQREYSEKVLTGVIPDDTWFAWICGLSEEDLENEDAWKDESLWPKANPCWGTAVRLEEMRGQALKAEGDPSSLDTFLRFRLCVWTTKFSTWIPLDKWDLCKRQIDLELLRGRTCRAGLDLSTTTDISAFVLLFDPVEADPYWRILPFFFLPKDNIAFRCRRDRVPYDEWAREGLFNLTPGGVIDYRAIRAKILELRDQYQYNVSQIYFDRWNSSDIVTNLGEDGFEMVRVGQGFAGMAYPTKRFGELALGGELAHDGNKVLRWMMSNVIVQQDPAGNKKPDKSKSREKIDGIVAAIMAVTGMMGAVDNSPAVDFAG